jgi:secreted PhoX family phosphatase
MSPHSPDPIDVQTSRMLARRQLLQRGAFGALGLSVFSGRTAIAAGGAQSPADGFGPLQPADANGLQLPLGFASRVVATSGQAVPGTNFVWHTDPDGGATFAAGDGGWVYVSNAERLQGGTNAIRFAADGTITNAYRILNGTVGNCAGGPTPWGTWLSCEETPFGRVHECDPLTPNSQGIARPRLGVFQHEAAAVDPVGRAVYLTEDREDGLLYRFIPTNYPDLANGILQAARIDDPLGQGPIQPGQVRPLTWFLVPDPTLQFFIPTRFQVPQATRFDGGEGCWYEAGSVHITTKGNNRVWRIDVANQTIQIVYDLATSANPQLSGVDNVFVTPRGDVLVAEDGGNMEIVALTGSGQVQPVVRLLGVSGSEITGPALTPDGTRLYFSSQRNPGRTYEVSGPWLGLTSVAVPASSGLSAAVTAAALAGAGALLLRRDARAEAGRGA